MKTLFIAIAILVPSLTHAQEHHGNQTETTSSGVIEITSSAIYAHSFEHDEGLYGTELHLTYWANETWGGGLAYTAKFEEGTVLHDIALIGSYNPFSWNTINTGPSFALGNAHRDFQVGLHIDTEFNIRPAHWVHFGPVIGTILGKETEVFFGLHLDFEIE